MNATRRVKSSIGKSVNSKRSLKVITGRSRSTPALSHNKKLSPPDLERALQAHQYGIKKVTPATVRRANQLRALGSAARNIYSVTELHRIRKTTVRWRYMSAFQKQPFRDMAAVKSYEAVRATMLNNLRASRIQECRKENELRQKLQSIIDARIEREAAESRARNKREEKEARQREITRRADEKLQRQLDTIRIIKVRDTLYKRAKLIRKQERAKKRMNRARRLH